MKLISKKAAVIIFIFLITLAIIFFALSRSNTMASLYVESNPSSSLYVDNKYIGETPLTHTTKSKEVVLSLEGKNGQKYSSKIFLEPGIRTVVRRDFFDEDGKSSGETIYFEKQSQNRTSALIVVNPVGATVSLDGQIKGVSPLEISNITEGSHRIEVTAENFVTADFTIQVFKGYRLISLIDLPKLNDANLDIPEFRVQENEATEEAVLIKKVVEILSTPTNFLRVRNLPNPSAAEIGRVSPSEKYDFVSEENGWFKILYKEGVEGWISSEYATVSAEERE